MKIFTLNQASYCYKNTNVFHNIKIEIYKHNWVVLTGANGSGKTTLVKLILGLIQPTSGLCYREPSIVGQQNEYISYLPQAKKTLLPRLTSPNTLLHCHATTLKIFFKNIYCMDNIKIHEALTKVGMECTQYLPINQLSRGQVQRIHIAQTLLHPAFKLLILDEPFAGVDQIGREKIMEILKIENDKKPFCLFMVSHDLYRISHHFDTILHIKDHQVHSCRDFECLQPYVYT
jgi:zinc transport system ATP-binding protein